MTTYLARSTLLGRLQRRAAVKLSGRCSIRYCGRSFSAVPSSDQKDASGAGAGTAESEAAEQRPQLSARTARAAEQPPGKVPQLTRVQRGGLGGVGAVLAAAGTGGLAWLHWPLLGPSSACALAGSCGLALLAVAAKGEVPTGSSGARPSPKPKRVLELKLLNEEVRLCSDLKALQELHAKRQWPLAVQTALSVADKSAAEAARAADASREEEVLKMIKEELAAGTSSDQIRKRLRPRLFICDFLVGQGPAAARPDSTKTQLEHLGASVTFVLAAATTHDEVLLRLTSPGGAVPPYGLAAAQLQRLRDAGVRLTVAVDTVAASGGYLMACVADHIVAAPFAYLGSIGVIAGSPNFSKVLERNQVEFTQVTAGKYKRTVNVLTPNTEEGIAKFREDVEIIHGAFKAHVQRWRPGLDVEEVATGEVWLGAASLSKGLIDEVGTSDDYIRQKVQDGFDAIELARPEKKKKGLAKLLEGVGGPEGGAEALLHRAADSASAIWDRMVAGSSTASAPRAEAPELREMLRRP